VSIGNLYHFGWGVSQDYTTAREWYEKAAAQGNADAQFQLGVLYQLGRGVPENHARALEWYEKAAAQGDQHAIEMLKKLK
jgi:hypothetical protein